MKYITEYRDKELAKKLVADIAKEARADKTIGSWSSAAVTRTLSAATAWREFCLKTSA